LNPRQDELNAIALNELQSKMKSIHSNKMYSENSVTGEIQDAKKYLAFKKAVQVSSSIQKPEEKVVTCSGCSTKTRIKAEVGKYRCPNCGKLLVYVKNNLTAHHVGVKSKPENPSDIQLNSKPKKNVIQNKQPNSLPIYFLPLIGAFLYFMVASTLGIFDFFGISDLSGMQKSLCFFVSIAISIFGFTLKIDGNWEDDWKNKLADYLWAGNIIVFGLALLFAFLGSLGGGGGGGECMIVGRFGDMACY
jgi:predicted RNA-binding Zn-ribbon protein involved in translation (DUF1610 family)